MAFTTFSHRTPRPARGLVASHRELRGAMAALRVAAEHAVCPPEGHAFWGLLRQAVERLEAGVARHVRHEARSFPSGTAQQARMEEQHTELIVKTAGLTRLVLDTRPGDAARWPQIRRAAGRLIQAMERHLDAEAAMMSPPARQLAHVELLPLAR